MKKRQESRLELHVPTLEELWYRQQLLADPKSMGYNREYDLDFREYHKDTGCIDFPESEWESWYDYFVGQEPERWYAYLVRMGDGRFVGEVNVHSVEEPATYDMGIVVEGSQRGQGYGREGLELLLEQAFLVMGVPALRNTFEIHRNAGLQIHLDAGFKEIGREDDVVTLMLTNEEYRKRRGLSCFT